MKKPDNPFPISGFMGKKWFCDREAELSELKDHLHNGRNVVLYAWRRMGKTALIQCLFKSAESKRDTDTVYVDLLAARNMQDAIRAITLAIHEKFGKTQSGISAAMQRLLANLGLSVGFDPVTGQPEISFGYHRTEAPERSFQALGEFLSGHKKDVVVALDEFQQVTDFEESNAEAMFRSWIQQFPGIRFIFSGSHRGMMVSMFAERNRPFYQSAQLMALDPIPLEKYTPFIQRHFQSHNKSIDTEIITRLYKWSRGQTYCVQLICNNLFGNSNNVSEQDLLDTYKRIIDQEKPIFANYQKILTHSQWALLRATAKEEPLKNPHSKDFLARYSLGAASSVQTSLASLIKKELIIEDGGEYLVHDVLLSRWLQRI